MFQMWNKCGVFKMKKKQTDIIIEELDSLRYKINIALTGIRNLLQQYNPNNVNGYLISIIEREL